ncbi:S1C family serine protease [Azohydromonas caseinilytica]|uniref:Trypsin-like peptidase domain-containing protein n=1 Tax=Azohydromonas caseinilytica TaxID=2728836 RepID=A0A848F7N3_9BURK|nr:serine protease [Azohydromonas caseinilytica]NML14766.1 trypsin-like peptidase domain-containing protein [Azohydromonas caseinilytica]
MPQFRPLAVAALLLAGSLPPAMAQLTALIPKVKPAVVVVGSWRATDNPRLGFRGTGFVVGDGRRVLTNAHVLPEALPSEAAAPLAIGIPRRRGEGAEVRRATLLALDRRHDLALLAIEGTPLPTLPLAAAREVPEGTEVGFTGFPIGGALGYSPVTHRGIVSAVTPASLPQASAQQLSNQAIRELREGPFELYQLDATAYPGNSGSPVFDAASGEVVAVLNMVFVKAGRESALTQPSGISYAIPIAHAHELLRRASASSGAALPAASTLPSKSLTD